MQQVGILDDLDGFKPYLVGFKHEFYFPFHLWVFILPIDELIFFKMVKTTDQIQLGCEIVCFLVIPEIRPKTFFYYAGVHHTTKFVKCICFPLG